MKINTYIYREKQWYIYRVLAINFRFFSCASLNAHTHTLVRTCMYDENIVVRIVENKIFMAFSTVIHLLLISFRREREFFIIICHTHTVFNLYFLIIKFFIMFCFRFFLKFFLKCNQNCLKNAGNPRDMRRFQVSKHFYIFTYKWYT